jgi:hypothetical protein
VIQICINHISLYKLGKYGIKGDLLCWLKSYLSNRTQRVMIKDALSGIGHLHAGVPQGSVLLICLCA